MIIDYFDSPEELDNFLLKMKPDSMLREEKDGLFLVSGAKVIPTQHALILTGYDNITLVKPSAIGAEKILQSMTPPVSIGSFKKRKRH